VEVPRQVLSINGRLGEIYTAFSPWLEIPPPPGYDPPDANVSVANLWECWFTGSNQPYCHPVGDVHFPTWNATLLNPGSLSGGISVTYEGLWGSRVRINALCDVYGNWDFPLQESIVQYSKTNTGAEYLFNVRSRTACARRFVDPNVPTPPPNAPQKTALGGPYGLRLWMLQSWSQRTFARAGETWHKAIIYFSLLELVGCPEDSDCGAYAKETANIWNCVGVDDKNCYPIGDRKYGLDLDFVNPENRSRGVIATDGGAANGETALIEFFCDPELEVGTVVQDDLSDEENGRISFFVLTSEVCNPEETGRLTGGAIFLFVILGLIVLYFGVGTLVNWLIGGYVDVLNGKFWLEIWASLVGAIMFIVSCGKEQPIGQLYENGKITQTKLNRQALTF
jgi:hypothetical protein